MIIQRMTLTTCATLLAVACTSTTPRGAGAGSPTASTEERQTTVATPATAVHDKRKSDDAIIGTPAPDSKFAKLKIDMQMDQVQALMGRAPDRTHTYESGKRWIPFYFGNDARRIEALYKGEGCLIFTGGNIWGGAEGDLIQIVADPAGGCYDK